MKIKLNKLKGNWYADVEDLPGAPPIGVAETKEHAVADLLYRILYDVSHGNVNWCKYIKFSSLEIEEK